jgi:DNA-binding transcriptional ArsR family regulator
MSVDQFNDDSAGGRYAYEGLDRVLHEKARLGILTCLVSHPQGLLFNDLKELCSLTDGNLSRHLQLLNQNGLIEIWKGFEKRKPQTLCRLSAQGQERYLAYLSELEKVLQDAQASTQRSFTGSPLKSLPPGWAPA